MRNRPTPRSSRKDGGEEANPSRSSRSCAQGARASKARTGSARSFSQASERRSRHARQLGKSTARVKRGAQARRNQGLGSSWAAGRAEGSSWPFATALPLVGVVSVVVLAVVLVMAVKSCSTPAGAPEEEQAAEEPVTPIVVNYTPSLESIDGVSDPGTVVQGAFLANADASYAPQLSDEGVREVQNAVSAITDEGKTVGFAFFNTETGKGYVYNLDQRVYGASSFKGPVLIYGCQQAIETGKTSISHVNANAQDAIVNSDNNSYRHLRRTFENVAAEPLSAWLSSLNVSSSLADDTSFPHYSARESLKLWMNTYLYLSSSSSSQEVTQWAKQLFSSTTVSMIRSGIDPASDPLGVENIQSVSRELQGAVLGKLKTTEVGTAKDAQTQASSTVVVYDKAGWINGTDDDAVCDAGIVEENGTSYLITVMTNLADSASSRAKVSDVAAVLWEQRDSLM